MKMKKMGFLCLALVFMFAISACALNKTAITAEEFTTAATSSGFTVVDETDQYEGKTVISLLAADSTESFQVEFHEVETQAQASSAYLQNKSTLDGIDSGTTISSNGNNWAKFSKTAGGAYGVISYIDTTFIYVRAPQEHKQAIQDLLKELGY